MKLQEVNYIINHIGNGIFDVTMKDGSVKHAGESMCGMIRYTYFEDYEIPPKNWSVDNLTLIKDYHMKVSKAICEGKTLEDISKM